MFFRSFKMLFLVSTYLFLYSVHFMCLVFQNDAIQYSGSINIRLLKSESVKNIFELTEYECIDNVASTFTDNGIIKKDSTYK